MKEILMPFYFVTLSASIIQRNCICLHFIDWHLKELNGYENKVKSSNAAQKKKLPLPYILKNFRKLIWYKKENDKIKYQKRKIIVPPINNAKALQTNV